MYQKIDETGPPPAVAQDTPAPRKTRAVVTFFVAIGFSLFLAAALWSYYKPTQSSPHPAAQSEAIDAFRRIQAETRTSIRRARLVDYVQNYPDSPISGGAREQLRVMNDYEARDWAALSDVMFAAELTPADKRFELERYTARWGEGLAGSRDDDVSAFKTALEDSLEGSEPIDRRHVPDGSPVPKTIDGTQLAGGQRIAPVRPIPPAPAPPPVRAAPIQPQADIKAARVRRPRQPDYPRRAYNRGVPAIVQLSLNVDARGRVGLVETMSVDAPRYAREFERAARRAAKRTRFYPKTIDGRPVPARDIRKTYVFNPEE